jgi:hypothetical protein
VSNDTTKSLAKVVLSLRAADHRAWEEFLSVLARRSSELDTSLVNSSPERIYTLQGQAQCLRHLIEELKRAPELANELYQKERANGLASHSRQTRA